MDLQLFYSVSYREPSYWACPFV